MERRKEDKKIRSRYVRTVQEVEEREGERMYCDLLIERYRSEKEFL
jgi:hypothetical protein